MLYFKFKEFGVWHGQGSLKVNTDSCLFGAYVASVHTGEQPKRVLDIGTGNGLLSLMLAQQLPHALIYGLDIVAETVLQAEQNFAESPWSERLLAMHADARQFCSAQNFELIVSNPPFFSKSLQNVHKTDIAKHQHTLSFHALATCIQRNLAELGTAWILLPRHEFKHFEKCCLSLSLEVRTQTAVAATAKHLPSKLIIKLRKKNQDGASEPVPQNQPELLPIKTTDGSTYAPEFRALLAPYYLKL